MKKLVLVLVALASLSFAADEKKEDCSKYLKEGDNYIERANRSSFPVIDRAFYSSLATSNYLRYQICKDLEKGK